MVHELDQDPEGRDMEKALVRLQGCNTPPVPAVFIAGELVGSTNEVMSLHLSGDLNRMLKPYKVVQENQDDHLMSLLNDLVFAKSQQLFMLYTVMFGYVMNKTTECQQGLKVDMGFLQHRTSYSLYF